MLRYERPGKAGIAGWITGLLLAIAVILAIGGFILMLAWNYAVVAAISVANPINFWHAVVLMIFILPQFRSSSKS
jgi:hypothetical protein